jgi:hypothetical protein
MKDLKMSQYLNFGKEEERTGKMRSIVTLRVFTIVRSVGMRIRVVYQRDYSETLVDFHQSARNYVPEHHSLSKLLQSQPYALDVIIYLEEIEFRGL